MNAGYVTSDELKTGIALTKVVRVHAMGGMPRTAARSDSTRNRFQHERTLLEQGVEIIAGLDEAGRGPLAGPVVAAAVILPLAWVEAGLPGVLEGLNDSKQLSAARRDQYFNALTNSPDIRYGIALEDSRAIDRWNILQATHRAMNAALTQLNPQPQHVLVDGRPVKSLTYPQTALVKGDSRSYSIAAASVLAKVTRDRMMCDYHARWPQYGFAEHKGYGTSAHLAAIAEHGPCPIHRMTFAPLKPTEQDLF